MIAFDSCCRQCCPFSAIPARLAVAGAASPVMLQAPIIEINGDNPVIIDAACEASQKLVTAPDTITSIGEIGHMSVNWYKVSNEGGSPLHIY